MLSISSATLIIRFEVSVNKLTHAQLSPSDRVAKAKTLVESGKRMMEKAENAWSEADAELAEAKAGAPTEEMSPSHDWPILLKECEDAAAQALHDVEMATESHGHALADADDESDAFLTYASSTVTVVVD